MGNGDRPIVMHMSGDVRATSEAIKFIMGVTFSGGKKGVSFVGPPEFRPDFQEHQHQFGHWH